MDKIFLIRFKTNKFLDRCYQTILLTLVYCELPTVIDFQLIDIYDDNLPATTLCVDYRNIEARFNMKKYVSYPKSVGFGRICCGLLKVFQ
jgi:hypothetical protein